MIFFIMQYIHSSQIQVRIPEDLARHYIAQITLALGQFHKDKIIYKNLRLENVLLNESDFICLTDFGVSQLLGNFDSVLFFHCQEEYMPPEAISGKDCTKAVDWWALGNMLYEMIVGIPPFYHHSKEVMKEFIKTKGVIFPAEKYKIMMSAECKDIIDKLLSKDWHSRLGSKNDADEVLLHPFFKGVDVQKLISKQINVSPKKLPVVSSPLDLRAFVHTPRVAGSDSKLPYRHTSDACNDWIIR